jgi:streptogramin lyase
MLEDQVFLDGLEKLWQNELTRYGSTGWADGLSPLTILPVTEIQGQADEYPIVPAKETGRAQSCEQVRSDANGVAWLSYPWQNSIVRFDPNSNERKDFLLDPRPADPSRMAFTGPDGIFVGSSGKVWYGEYQNGVLGMIDPVSNQAYRFDPKGSEVAIVAEGPDGHVWATSHQAKTIWEYDPSNGNFRAWKTRQEWPRDVRADRFGQAWVTAGGSNAVLLRLDRESELVYEYPIVKDAGALWLDQDPEQRYVYVTTQQKGLFIFDKLTKSFKNIQREDTHQNYLPITVSKDGLIAIGNTSGADYLSIDVIDPKKPERILAYKIPTQNGLLKEGLSFDPQNRIWYCQTYTDIVGRLHL